MHFRTFLLLFACLIAGQGDLAGSAHAQELETREARPPTPLKPQTGDIIYLRDANGNPQPVPITDQSRPSLTELLNGDDDEAVVPDAFIAAFAAEGQVVKEWADLTVRVEVHVLKDNTWLPMPLRLDQALLLDYSHDGVGDAAPSVANQDDDGITWLLRGKGVHKLRLSLRVPLRKMVNGSQLQLTIPDLPKLFAGDFTIKIPGERLSIETGADVKLLGEPQVTGGVMTLVASLSGPRLDVRWRALANETTPISSNLAQLTLRLRSDVVQLTARQEVRLRQTGLTHLEVRLPSGEFSRTTPVRVSDLSGAERQVTPLPAEREGWVKVPLAGVVGTAVRLDWTFEAPFGEETAQLQIDGLEVTGADVQSGTIAIEGFDQHLLTRQPDLDQGVSRIGINELPAAGAFANLAYKFQSGNYRLVLDVDSLEANYRVTPVYLLRLTELQASLTARFLVSMDSGQVDALSIDWRHLEGPTWNVEPVAAGGGEVRHETAADANGAENGDQESAVTDPTTDRWLLKTAKPLVDGSQPGLLAQRPISISDGTGRLLSALPEVADARMLPAILVVATGDNLEAQVDSPAGLTVSPISDASAVPSKLLESLGDESRAIYHLQRSESSVPLSVDIRLTLRPMQVDVRSALTVRDVDVRPSVTQEFEYDVRFGRLESVRLRVPQSLLDEIPEEFRDQSLTFLLDGKALASAWTNNEVELTFAAPRRGAFRVQLKAYKLPSLPRGSSRVAIPIITSSDFPLHSVRLLVADADTVSLAVAGDDWTRIPTTVDGAEWITSSSVEEASVTIDHALSSVPQRLAIQTAYMQTTLGSQGMLQTVSQYRLPAGLDRIVVGLPFDVQQPQFTWDSKQLDEGHVVKPNDIENQYLVTRPDSSVGESWLTIAYLDAQQELGWSRTNRIRFPVFGDQVWVKQTFWDVQLPQTQHLLHGPDELAPQYSWQRAGLFWQREPLAGATRSRQALQNSGGTDVLTNGVGPIYPFETLGQVSEIQITTASNSLLVLWGAGLTLVGSFLVMKVRAARNLWLWLAVGTVAAIFSLWYLEAILLLLQPALCGLILPLCAAVLEWLTDRRTIKPESLSTHGSFDLQLPATVDDSHPSAEEDFQTAAVPSTLVRPQAVSDSGVR